MLLLKKVVTDGIYLTTYGSLLIVLVVLTKILSMISADNKY